MASVTLSGIRKSFGPVEVIKGVDLAIKDREFVVFVGPSGCGKSTLLRMIAGLEDVSAGAIAIDGEIVNEQPPSQRQIAMVFQSYALYPHKTVRDNMSFGLRMAKVDKATITRKVLEAAKALDLEPLLDRRPKELSGGQRQRVAIGRAIVRNPRLFLFDEPLSNLDAALRSQMRVEIARLHQALDTTMIYVTHDQIEAMTLADKIVVLNGGRIEQIGAPLDLYHTPSNLFVAGFIGSPRMNFLQATVAARVADALEVRLRHGAVVRVCTASPKLKAGDAVTLGIRPEHLELAESSALVVGRALVVERLGSGTHVHLQSEAGEMLIATLDGLVHVGVGEAVSLRFPARCCHVFDANGDSVPLAARAEDKELLQSSDRSAGTGSGATLTSCRRSSRETET